MRVSVVIPMRNEGRHIGFCLDALLGQDFPADQMEILVIDGLSSDGSRQVVARYGARDARVHLLDNPSGTTPAALNIGIRKACGEYVVRVDARTVIARDYVRRCAELLDESGAANVGGRMQPIGETYVGRAVALATTSPFGIGDSKFHYSAERQAVDTVYMGAFRREIFDRVGLFDEELIRNQDYELNVRIRDAGGEILLSPEIVSYYTPRSSLGALWRQYFQYGRWKVRTLRKHRHSLRWRQAAPPALVAGLVGSFALGLVWAPAQLLFGMATASYLGAALAASAVMAHRGGWRYFPVLPVVFATLHLSWGLGFWWGVACELRERRAG